MPAPRVLLVKLSSLGDVIHLLPAVTDLARARPEVEIDWAVEEGFAPVPAMHPAVRRAIPVSLRRLRARPLSPSSWGALAGVRGALRAGGAYDWIVDAQGLLKSVAVGRLAKGALFGFDRASIREKAAARFYDMGLAVPRDLHAVERCRRLLGAVFGYAPSGEADYGIAPPLSAPDWVPRTDYVVGLHASSKRAKRWPDAHWRALAERLANEDIAIVYPGGSPSERVDAARLAGASSGALAAPAMTLPEAAALLARASAVVGVDTGLTHLAVALGCPTVGLYVATKPGLTGLHGGPRAVNLGGPGTPPSPADVARVLFGAGAAA
jgi:heptosyltransferase-1